MLRRRYGRASGGRTNTLTPEQIAQLRALLGKYADTWYEVTLPNGRRAKIKAYMVRGTEFLKVHTQVNLREPASGTVIPSGEMITINTRTRTARNEPGWFKPPVWEKP